MDKTTMISAMRRAWKDRTDAARHDFALGVMIRSASNLEYTLITILRDLNPNQPINPRSPVKQLLDRIGDHTKTCEKDPAASQLAAIAARCRAPLARRNDYVHGLWLIDPEEEDPGFLARDLGKPGGVDVHIATEADVLELAAELSQLNIELLTPPDGQRWCPMPGRKTTAAAP